jgi:S-adenosylmethionine decarboxylase
VIRLRSTGNHVLADLFGVSARVLEDAGILEVLMRESAQHAGARILDAHFHSFGTGHGVTGVVLLAESHMSIHTWPESGFAALDIFMCGAADARRALDALLASLAPVRRRIRIIERGALPVERAV